MMSKHKAVTAHSSHKGNSSSALLTNIPKALKNINLGVKSKKNESTIH